MAITPTTLSWSASSGNLSGNWGDPAHWTKIAGGTDTTPNLFDTAYIAATGSAYTVTIATSGGGTLNATVSSLYVQSADATVNYSTAGASSLVYGNLVELDAGTIAVGTNDVLRSSTTGVAITVNGGKLIETGGTVAVGNGGTNSNFNVNGGTVSLTGGITTVNGNANFTGGTGTIGNTFSAGLVDVTGSGTTVNIISGGVVTDTTTQFTIAAGATLQMSGGTVISTASGFADAGLVTGYGVVTAGTGLGADFAGAGSITASGGTLTFNGAVGASTAPAFSLADNSTLVFSNTVGSLATVNFGAGTGDTLSLTSLNAFNGTLSNFAAGDTIQVAGAQSFVLNGTTLQAWSGANGGGGVLQTLIFNTAPHGGETVNGSTFTVCFAAGSRIRTEDGDVAVEQLAEGQRVAVLRDGTTAFTPITWIGERRINLAAHPQPQTAAPVRIRQGAIGENMPERDLLLSPDHCLFLDGKLIPAKSLINGMTIVQERWLPAVHYFHVEVDPHAVLLAEGLPVESYLDTGNRAYFQNAGAALVLHPEFTVNAGLKAWETHACAPLTVQPDVVKPVWQRLADRAEAMGFAPQQPETTDDADLHLLANGRTIRPMTVQDGRYVFALPAGCETVRLASRAAIPSDLAAYVDDWRALGVAVTRMVVRTQGTQAVIPADHPGLKRGWHSVESDGATAWRWTDGNAEVALDATDGPAILELHLCNTTRYIVEATEAREVLAA